MAILGTLVPMIVTLALSGILCATAAAIILTQLASYRRARAQPHDLFVYTRRRLHVRIAGAVLLALIGLTFAGWELGSSGNMSAATASRLLSLLIAEVVMLFVVAVMDLRETSKTAGRQPHNFDFEELARLRRKNGADK